MHKEDEQPDHIDYPAMIDEAMRGVVRKTLQQVEAYGLPGKHHLYITFHTLHPGVQISPQLKERFREEMTIVLQYQFWDLEVEEERFSVMLSFNNTPERLVIPFSALTGFADPSIRFGLQFQAHQPGAGLAGEQDTSFESPFPQADNLVGGKAASAEVISLDAFRKK